MNNSSNPTSPTQRRKANGKRLSIVEDPLVLNTFKIGDKNALEGIVKAPLTAQNKADIKSAFKDYRNMTMTMPQSPVAPKLQIQENKNTFSAIVEREDSKK